MALPWDDADYSIIVSWLDIKFEAQEVAAKNGCATWMKDLGRRSTDLAYGSSDNIPDVFVYLRYKDDNICYVRIPSYKISTVEKTARWYEFIPDRSIDMVKNDWEAGFIKLRLYLGKYEGGPGPKVCDWGKNPEIR